MAKGPSWKREIVADHKFDFVDTREFTDNSFGMRMKYLWLYVIVLKSFLVYVSDIFSATTMLTTKGWSNQIFANCQHVDGCFFIPFNVGRWLFVGCIIFSFLLLAYEARKSKKIIASRDISYSFTNVMANHYWSLRSYDHFCFFDHISNSTKKKDDFAFFIFFTFKSWKRVLLADAPRQTINALTLYSIYLSKKGNEGAWYDIPKYFQNNNLSTTLLTITTTLTVVVFAGSLILLMVAGVCYIPLLCYIQGNLKEYVCHKVDKRIAEVIKRRNKERLAKAAALAKKEAMGDYSHLKNKKGEMIAKPLPQPTLPNLSVDDDDFDDSSSMRTRGPPPSTYTQDYYSYNDNKSAAPNYSEYAEYPPMPAYQPYPNDQYAQYNPSQQTLAHEEPHYYEDEYETANLPAAAAPMAYDQHASVGSAMPNPHGSMGMGGTYVADAHDVYAGRAVPSGQFSHSSATGPPRSTSPGAGYAVDYPSPTTGGFFDNRAPPPQGQHDAYAGHTQDAYGGHVQQDAYSGHAQHDPYAGHVQQDSYGGYGGQYQQQGQGYDSHAPAYGGGHAV